jgi:low density lipoprotein-related protein 2
MNCNNSVVTPSIQETEKEQQTFCRPTEFHCDSGECIDRRKLCNNEKDCLDGTDEHIWCGVCQEDNGGCQQFCKVTPNGAECFCSTGHRLLPDHQKCADIDECAENENLCDHFCNNTRGRYNCYCAPGYTLALDDSTCKLTSKDGFLLFATGSEIRQVDLNEKQQGARYDQLLEVETGDVLGLDHNNVNHHTYYLNGNKIYFYLETPICAVEGMHHGINVAVDWVTNNIYFADESPAKLGVCYWSGRYCTLFVVGDLNNLRGLALHPKRGVMLWTDWGDFPRIEKANMDGTKRLAIVTEKVVWPNGVTLDYVREKVYWADAKWQMIERCNLDGNYREVIVSKNVRHPFDLVVFMDKVFWSDWSNQAIMAASLSDRTDNTIIHTVLHHPFGVAVNHAAYHDGTLFNPCQTANCSHICALKANDTSESVTFTCLCPNGYTILNDNATCFPTSPSLISAPYWCLDTFRNACIHGHACHNNGVCRQTYDTAKNLQSIKCECPRNFAGLYCEISLDEVNWKQLISSSLKVHHEYLLTGHQNGSSGVATTTIIVLIVLICFGVATLYVVKKVDFRSRHFHGLKWNPAVLFRRRLSSQREHFIQHEEGGNSKLEKAESFSNPVYEAVNVPLHSAYMTFKKKSVTSDCGDNDSGLEFNISRSSASSPSSPSLC